MAAAGPATYSVGLANERLRLLEELEREIGAALQSAGGAQLGGEAEGGEGRPLPLTCPPPSSAASPPPPRHGDPGAVQGEAERAAAGPAGGAVRGLGAEGGGGALGPDPLPDAGGHPAAPRGLELRSAEGLPDGPEAGRFRPPQACRAGPGLRADVGAVESPKEEEERKRKRGGEGEEEEEEEQENEKEEKKRRRGGGGEEEEEEKEEERRGEGGEEEGKKKKKKRRRRRRRTRRRGGGGEEEEEKRRRRRGRRGGGGAGGGGRGEGKEEEEKKKRRRKRRRRRGKQVPVGSLHLPPSTGPPSLDTGWGGSATNQVGWVASERKSSV